MSDAVVQWRESVAAAATTGNSEALRDLFVSGRSLFGDQVGQEWARTLSALDAAAITG